MCFISSKSKLVDEFLDGVGCVCLISAIISGFWGELRQYLTAAHQWDWYCSASVNNACSRLCACTCKLLVGKGLSTYLWGPLGDMLLITTDSSKKKKCWIQYNPILLAENVLSLHFVNNPSHISECTVKIIDTESMLASYSQKEAYFGLNKIWCEQENCIHLFVRVSCSYSFYHQTVLMDQ